MTVLVPVNWHLYAWQQAIVHNVQVISKNPDKVWLRLGSLGTIMFARLVHRCETATAMWVLCHLTASIGLRSCECLSQMWVPYIHACCHLMAFLYGVYIHVSSVQCA